MHDDCSGLYDGWWVCVGIQSQSSLTLTYMTTTTPVTIPSYDPYTPTTFPSIDWSFTATPTNLGLVPNCQAFYQAAAVSLIDYIPLLYRWYLFLLCTVSVGLPSLKESKESMLKAGTSDRATLAILSYLSMATSPESNFLNGTQHLPETVMDFGKTIGTVLLLSPRIVCLCHLPCQQCRRQSRMASQVTVLCGTR